MASTTQLNGSTSTSGPGTDYFRSELQDLKVIGVEEHIAFPDLTARITEEGMAGHAKQMFARLVGHKSLTYAHSRLTDGGAQRIRDMDEGGISVQLLSLAGPVNCTLLEPEPGLALSRDINDRLHKIVGEHPARFKALADLPFHAPELAIVELRRCVQELGFVGAMMAGSVGCTGKFLDAPEFDGLLSEFEALGVPLYLHPGIPPPSIMETYFTVPGNPMLSATLGGMGWGWHNEVAIHVLRLAVTGALDRHPNLKLVVGHQGEMLPMMLQRFDTVFDEEALGLKRNVAEILRS